MWIFYLENYSYVALAFSQRQTLLSLLGFIVISILSWCWRHASVRSLLPAWLFFWVWMLPLSLLASPTALNSGLLNGILLGVREHVQLWLPLQILAPCGLPYVERLSDNFTLLPLLSWNKLILGLWILLAAGKALGMLNQRRRLSGIAKGARLITEPQLLAAVEKWRRRYRLRRSVALRSSDESQQAFTIGVLRPLVFLPEHLLQALSDTDLDAILGHELAHIKRCDDLFVCFQLISKSLLFFNPLVWFSGRRITSLRERCCDLLAIRASDLAPQSYAESLLRVAELHNASGFDSEVAAGLTSSALTKRVHYVLSPHKNNFTWLPLIAAMMILPLLNLALMPDIAGIDTIRDDEAKALLTELHALPPMPRATIVENFIGDTHATCALPQRARYHPGIDFVPGSTGDRSVRAIADGEISAVIHSSAYFGALLQINHANGVTSTYVHLGDTHVQRGEHIYAGQQIGTVDGDHLHLELRKGGRIINPSVL